jgi:hypothetical protein
VKGEMVWAVVDRKTVGGWGRDAPPPVALPFGREARRAEVKPRPHSHSVGVERNGRRGKARRNGRRIRVQHDRHARPVG